LISACVLLEALGLLGLAVDFLLELDAGYLVHDAAAGLQLLLVACSNGFVGVLGLFFWMRALTRTTTARRRPNPGRPPAG
jgi:hypothetical protein